MRVRCADGAGNRRRFRPRRNLASDTGGSACRTFLKTTCSRLRLRSSSLIFVRPVTLLVLCGVRAVVLPVVLTVGPLTLVDRLDGVLFGCPSLRHAASSSRAATP